MKYLYLSVGCWLLSILNAFAQLSGTVFKDFNNDGFQTPPHELGCKQAYIDQRFRQLQSKQTSVAILVSIFWIIQMFLILSNMSINTRFELICRRVV